MAARPKSVDALYATRVALGNVATKLNDIASKAGRVIEENPHLNKGEIAHYKACMKAAMKQLTVLGKIDTIALPSALPAEPPKPRGRPPKAKAAGATDAPKRRGRPPKAKPTAAEASAEAAPKRRGRPPKVKVPTETSAVVAPKRRGRPPKAKPAIVEGEIIATVPRVSVETIDALQAKVEKRMAEDVAPRKRGRPKGSKNKPKTVIDASIN